MGGMALGGLISGMSTDDVIKKIMDVETIRVNLEASRKVALQAKQDSWRKVKSSLETLRSKLDGIRLASSFQQRSVSVSDDTIATATVSAGATVTSHSLQVTSLATAHSVTGSSNATAADTALGLAGKFTLQAQKTGSPVGTVTVAAGDSLNAIRDKINSSGAGIAADVVKVVNGSTTSYQLSLTSKSLGQDGSIVMSDDQAGALISSSALNFKTPAGAWASERAATDAVFQLDGRSYSMNTNTINDVVPGLALTLKKAQTAPAGGGAITPVTLGVANDPSRTVSAVQDWAKAVNDTLDLIKSETSYDVDRKTGGALNGDALARSLGDKLRAMLSTKNNELPVTMNQLSQVGVSTGAWGTDNFGKLGVDSVKLTAQLTKDPDAVARIFGGLTDLSSKGVARDMYTYVNGLLKFQVGDISTRDAGLSDQVKSIDDRITAMNSKLKAREVQLRAQFTRMEMAMANAQSMGGGFMSQVAGLMGQSQK